MTQEPDNDLTSIRAAIDEVDAQIVALIAQRQRWVEAAGRDKAGQGQDAVAAPDRVAAVVVNVRALALSSDASPDVVEATYRAMIAAFIELESVVAARSAELR